MTQQERFISEVARVQRRRRLVAALLGIFAVAVSIAFSVQTAIIPVRVGSLNGLSAIPGSGDFLVVDFDAVEHYELYLYQEQSRWSPNTEIMMRTMDGVAVLFVRNTAVGASFPEPGTRVILRRANEATSDVLATVRGWLIESLEGQNMDTDTAEALISPVFFEDAGPDRVPLIALAAAGVAAVLLGILFAVLAGPLCRRAFDRSAEALPGGDARLIRELETPLFSAEETRLTSGYLLGVRGRTPAVMPVRSMVWTYIVRSTGPVGFFRSSMVFSAHCYFEDGTRLVCRLGSSEQGEQFWRTLETLVPGAVSGFSKERLKRWKKDREGFLQEVERRWRARGPGSGYPPPDARG